MSIQNNFVTYRCIHNYWHHDSFNNELSNTITILDDKILLVVIEDDDSNLSSIISVYHSCTNINELLRSKTRPKRTKVKKND